MAVGQFDMREPMPVRLPLQRVRGGIPAIEIAHDAHRLRFWRMAEKTNRLGHFSSREIARVPGGNIRHNQRTSSPVNPTPSARTRENRTEKPKQIPLAPASANRHPARLVTTIFQNGC